jgi:hypothetical protein
MSLTTKNTIAIFIIFITSLVCTSAHANTKDSVTIALSPLDKNHIQLEYTLPKTCKNIAFLHNHQAAKQLRKDWAALDKCSHISTEGVLEAQASCTSIKFSVKTQATEMDRIYPPAYPLDDEGVLMHTGMFSIESSCGDIYWKFSAPKGAIIIDGTHRGKKTIISQKKYDFIKFTGAFLSYKPRKKMTPVIATSSTPEWLTNSIIQASAQITNYYKKTYPLLAFSPPTLFISNQVKEGKPSHQADVSSPRMIRFGLFDYPSTPDTHLIALLRSVTAHEFVHLLQQQDIKNSENFIHEGGAEAVRWIAEFTLGWRDKNSVANELSEAISYCLNIADGLAWKNVRTQDINFGSSVYRCGLALHIIGLASRQNNESAEETIHKYYQTVKSAPNTDFAQALECGTVKECSASWLPSLFKGEASVEQQIDDQLVKLGLVNGRSVLNDSTTALAARTKAFKLLMAEDCDDAYGFYTNEDHFLTAGISPQCKSFKNNLFIENVNDISYFKMPLEAVEAQNKGCREHRFVTLGTLDKKSITIACTKEHIPRGKILYNIDIDRLFMLLEKKLSTD